MNQAPGDARAEHKLQAESPEVEVMRLNALLSCVLVGVLASACATHGPVVDTGPRPEGVGGTIAGLVSSSGGATALAGRKVTAINQQSGERFEATTAANGGYTIKVPAGTYRLDVELRPGERLEKGPEATDVNVGDLDPDRNFVVTAGS